MCPKCIRRLRIDGWRRATRSWRSICSSPKRATILWKKTQRRELDENEARKVHKAVQHVPLRFSPTRLLAPVVFDLALALDRTMYDSLYLALAIAEDARLVTPDKKLVEGLRGTSIERYVTWVADHPAVD